jgi:hypothetical protein
MSRRLPTLALVAALLAGCSSIGPPTLTRDRFDYNAAISDSWKQQVLLNLVRLRYADVPVFLDVTNVINAYALEGTVSLGGQQAPVGRSGDTFIAGQGSATYSDHPTITYTPLVGDKFAKTVMQPIPVAGILLLVQSGYPADAVMRFCVNSVNGLENSRGGNSPRPADAKFTELLELLRADQLAGGLGFPATPATARREMTMLLRTPPLDEDMAARHRRLWELLGLRPDTKEIDIGYGSFPSGDTEVAMLSRSTLQVMLDVASFIDTPETASTAAPPVVTVPAR